MIGACITTYREDVIALAELLENGRFRVFVVDAEATGKRRGVATCMMDAWRQALEAGCDTIVQMDDGGGWSHDPYQANRLLIELYRGRDMVIGSRFIPNSQVGPGSLYIGNFWRAMLSRIASAMCNRKTGLGFTDWTSGYRTYTKEALSILLDQAYDAEMHGWQIEVLYHAWKSGLSISEVPITYRAGRSSFNLGVALEAFRVWRNL